MNKKALIAMSGGVDSSVAALLMKEQEYDCTGITMKLISDEISDNTNDGACCGADDIADAKYVCERLGIQHFVFNFDADFKANVIEPFIRAYENGMTPNPCIDCNRNLKFGRLFQKASELKYDCVVTGHYAKIGFDEKVGRYLLKKAADPAKDQSYVLYNMTQDQLSRTILPLGVMQKQQIREIAEENGFINASKPDSQDICFIKNGSYADFIERITEKKYPGGNFVDESGKVIGRHKGIIRYTVGQHKGLGLITPNPMYVKGIDLESNTVILCEKEGLYEKSFTAKSINLIKYPELYQPLRLKAKVRYRQTEQWATAVQTDESTLSIEFDEPQRAVTPGQSVVLYEGEDVIGGGIIQK